MRRLLFILALCCCAFAADAGLPGSPAFQYRALAWKAPQGLPPTVVTSVVQAPAGYIWAGTQDGLVRFDGVHFKIFSTRSNPRLKDNYINSLLFHDGRLWIGTRGGINIYEKGRLRALPVASGAQLAVNALGALDGVVLAASDQGLYRLSPDAAPEKVEGLPETSVTSIAVDADDTLWVGVKGGVWSRRRGATKFEFHPLARDDLAVIALAAWHGDVWVGTSTGLYRVHDGQFSRFGKGPIAEEYVDVLKAGPRGGLWIGTVHGLFRIGAHNRLQDFRVVAGVGAAWVQGLGFDREGDVWLGTSNDGLIRLANVGVARFGKNAGLEASTVWSVYRGPQGRFWAGTEAGVYEFEHSRLEPRFDAKKLPSSLVLSFLRVGKTLWIGTLKGLAMARDGRLVDPPPGLAELPNSLIYSLSPARGGGVWIGTSVGLYRFKAGHLRHFGSAAGLPQTRARVVRDLGDRGVWVGTEHGLYIGRDGHFHQAGKAAGIGDNVAVQGLYAAPNGVVWLTTRGGMIARYKNKQFTVYDKSDGIDDGMLFGLATDGQGGLWIAGRAIYKISVADFDRLDAGQLERIPMRAYNVPDARHPKGCNGGGLNSEVLDADGVFWCPVTGALVAVDTRRAPARSRAPRVAIEQVGIGKQFHVGARLAEGLIVPPGHANWAFKYAGFNFRHPRKLTFQYKLVGYDKHWIDAGARRDAFYTNLPPGHYVFKVKAMNGAGAASVTPAAVAVTLKPYYWQTNWFRALCALAVALLLYLFYRWRMRHARAQQQALEATVTERTAELRHVNEKLKAASMTDALTGLNNRRHLADQIGADIAQARRAYTAPDIFPNNDIVFFMVDVDDFKSVNDHYGHQAGDRLLVQLSQALKAQIRESDYAVRWGGEEFLIVARQTENAEAPVLADRLRRAAARDFEFGEATRIHRTCSIGWCGFPLTPKNLEHPDWEGVITLADMAMYKAKKSGKNTWAGIRATDGINAENILARIREDFDAMVEGGELTLVRPGETVEGNPETA
jgi:diguanylate cyclase (GGDEF)-like protein